MINELRPAYRVLDPSGFFSDDDTLYAEGAEIYFDGVPNDQLEPLNQIAKEKLITYLEEQEKSAKAAAEKAGRAYAGRPRTLDGGLALATAIQKAEMGTIGTKLKQTSTEVLDKEVPEVEAKRGRGRPKKAA